MKTKPKMRCCSFKQTHKDKLKDLAETKKCSEVLIKHYTFILEHFDEIIAKHDEEIIKIDAAKALVLKEFIAAPEKLIQLSTHLVELQKKTKETKTSTSKVKQVKSLRERLAVLEQECKAEGINIE